MSRRFGFLLLALVAVAHGLRVPWPARRCTGTGATTAASTSSTRRTLLARAASFAALGTAVMPSHANTEAELAEPMSGFGTGEEKRKAFLDNQKKYKKAWRRELSNLEFASNDEEAIAAVDSLFKLIQENKFEVPEGVRKMDLDQVYKAVQPKLGKNARMNFQKLDQVVRDITSVKGVDKDELGY